MNPLKKLLAWRMRPVATWLRGAESVCRTLRGWSLAHPIVLRAGVLLALLVALKGMLLWDLIPHLYHTHWRLGNHDPTLFDHANFLAFAGLVMTTALLLGRRLAGASSSTIRGTNLGLVVAALLFVVLTFKRINWNYLYPLMTGTLEWRDVGHYLIQDLFFQVPYLFVYLFVYALLYWILARTGREHWTVYVFGCLAAVYWRLNLRGLCELTLEVLVVNCVGLAGLLSCLRSRRPLAWPWLLLPVGLAAAGWGLFAVADPTLRTLDPPLVVLLALTAALVALAWVLGRRASVFPVLSHFLPFYAAAFLVFTNRNYPLAGNYNHLIAYGLSLPHYCWQELLLVAVLATGLVAWHRRCPVAAVRLFNVAALGLVLLSLLDVQVTQRIGFRLDWHGLVMNTDPVLLLRTLQPFLGTLATGVGTVVAMYFGLLWLGKRWAVARARSRLTSQFMDAAAMRKSGSVAFPSVGPLSFGAAVLLLLTFATPRLSLPDKGEGLGLANIVATSPLLAATKTAKLTAAEFDQHARALGFSRPAQPPVPATPRAAPADLNVLLVIMESSYNRYLSLFGAPDETQPLLKKYRDRMELFPNFYANWPCSINARFTVLSGFYAPNTYATDVNPRLEAPTLLDILHDRGRVVSLFDSCYRHYQKWNDFLAPRKLDVFHDADTMPFKERYPAVSWGMLETVTLAAITNQLAGHAQRRERFFLTYLPVAPHMPFDSPSKEFEQFDNGCGVIDGNYTGRYKNQLLYMDWILASLLDELQRLGLLDHTLVLITNDHGEMVGEDNGKLGHGWNLAPHLSNVPLIVLDPRRPGPRLNYTPGSHVDVFPTLLDLLHLPRPAGEFYQGVSLYDAPANRNKIVYLTSHRHRALIRGDRYLLERRERQSPGEAAPVEVYEISFDGPKTIFTKRDETAQIAGQLDQFEVFQKSLLVHYTAYRRWFRPSADDLTVQARSRQP